MNGPDKVTEDDHDSPDRTAVTQTACWSLVIGPVDRCKGPSRENEQANTHNELAEYLRAPGRVKTGVPGPVPDPRRRPGAARNGSSASYRAHRAHTGCTARPSTSRARQMMLPRDLLQSKSFCFASHATRTRSNLPHVRETSCD